MNVEIVLSDEFKRHFKRLAKKYPSMNLIAYSLFQFHCFPAISYTH